MAKVLKRKLSKKEQKAAIKTADFREEKNVIENVTVKAKKEVCIPPVVTVKDFAEIAGLPVTQVITVLMKSGVLATLNETIDFETAEIIGDDLGISVVPEEICGKLLSTKKEKKTETSKNLVTRPPVVTIMGHVDHGKTTLLDNIRTAHVAAGESGGITQHISAYQVTLDKTKNKNIKNRTITFIDTPGHAAFSAMREHGTAITDIVVLIVAAEDGVMPQTIEVIEDAKMNNVPIIVAINKVDLPDSDIMKVKQQLSEHELVPEEWGGKTTMVEISAKTGEGVDDLLEIILLQTDLMDLKADPAEKAVGVVIESHIHKGAGAMALVLVENGTLRKGDPIAIGQSFGRVRILEDFAGRAIESAGPSFPARVAGLKSVPNFGNRLIAFDSEKEARENATKSERLAPTIRIATAKRISDNEKYENSSEEYLREYKVVLKADVNGSLEAIKKLFSEIKSEEISLTLISEGVGPISESDVTLAKAIRATVIGFRVKALGAAKKIADKEEVQIKTFDVIYELVDYVKNELSLLMKPEIIEEELGRGEILAIFRDDRKGFVAGGRVESGKISNGNEIKILQNNNEKYRAKILSLRKEKNEAREVESGTECGFSLPAGANIAVGDTFVAFKTIQKARTIQ